MLKAKITKKIVPILSAIISVIFAFIIGVTYCSSVINLRYGTNLKSTQAYLANQQYVVVNDLEQSPILYNPGVYPVNISLQYAIDYDFDLRVKYSIDWLGDTENNELSTNNVELLFANRDNVIVDEEYIYYINYSKDANEYNIAPAGLSAGSSELSLIAGVEIVDSVNSEYAGKTLTISIDEVKIHKAGVTYDRNHALYENMTHSVVTKNAIESNLPEGKETVVRESAKAWLAHKQSITNGMDYAYVMVYNHRYCTDTGISSPGHNSAYSKTTTSGSSTVTASWIGGNRAFAGVGLHIITGSKPIAISAKVTGTWRNISGTSDPQFDDNIRVNYASDWVSPIYESNNLFETRDYNYIIPANTACYLEIVDSIEITTVGMNYEIVDLNTYKMVVGKIIINGTTFAYDGFEYDAKITSGTLNCVAIDENDERDNYKQKKYVVVSSSKYSNNMYEYLSTAKTQSYNNDNLILINNTSNKQSVKINYGINYYASNGSIELTYEGLDSDNNKIQLRADSFDDDAYFKDKKQVLSEVPNTEQTNYYNLPYDEDLQAHAKIYTIAPYSSFAIDSIYSLTLNFQTYLDTKYSPRDVWVEIEATIDYINSTTTNDATSNLLVEMDIDGPVGTIRIKNVSNEVVTAISAEISLENSQHMVATEVSGNMPNDWQATFWRYYTKSNNVPSQNQSNVWDNEKTYYKEYYYTPDVILTEVGGSSTYKNSYTCTNKTVNLKPNESIDLLTFSYPADADTDLLSSTLMLNATATASTAEDLNTKVNDELKYPAYFVTNGVKNCYIVNTSQTSCVVRFEDAGTDADDLTNVVKDGDYYYYTIIVRPGQILQTTSTISEVEVLPVEATYSVDYFVVDNDWGSKTDNGDGAITYSPFIQALNNIFS